MCGVSPNAWNVPSRPSTLSHLCINTSSHSLMSHIVTVPWSTDILQHLHQTIATCTLLIPAFTIYPISDAVLHLVHRVSYRRCRLFYRGLMVAPACSGTARSEPVLYYTELKILRYCNYSILLISGSTFFFLIQNLPLKNLHPIL